MIVRKVLDWRIVLRVGWRRMLTLIVISTCVAFAYKWFGNQVSMSTLPASILGIAIAFLIGFRVNSAYDRWWEGRKIWGAIVNDSRTFARQIITMIRPGFKPHTTAPATEAVMKELVYGQLAFVWALNWNLRTNGEKMAAEVRRFFDKNTADQLLASKNTPNAILMLQASRLEAAFSAGHTEDFRHMQIDATITRLCESMGMAERIKSTVFPRQYAYYSTLFTRLYSYMIPFVLVPETGYWVVPFTLLIGFIFFALDGIAAGIENPFNNSFNDTPMTAICTNIEINLREMLGERDLPAPTQPVNGFLM